MQKTLIINFLYYAPFTINGMVMKLKAPAMAMNNPAVPFRPSLGHLDVKTLSNIPGTSSIPMISVFR